MAIDRTALCNEKKNPTKSIKLLFSSHHYNQPLMTWYWIKSAGLFFIFHFLDYSVCLCVLGRRSGAEMKMI